MNDYNISDKEFLELQEQKDEILVKQKRNKIEQMNDFTEIFAYDFIQKYPCYYDENKMLYLYDISLNKWVKRDERDLVCIAKNLMRKSGLNNSQNRTAFNNAILDRARWDKPLEVPKNWIHFNDCFYDINTDERIPAHKKYFSQIKVPHKLGTSEETPIIDKHIISWVGEKQYKLFVQICAYCMYKSYPFARFFIFYGTGQDGKSTAGEFMSNLIGTDNTCSVDIDSLHTNRFESQKMYQKTLAICGEVDYKLLKNTRALKGVTGGDPLTIEFKNKDPFTYKNFAKLLWYANGVPPTYDKTQGFYRRTVIIKFPNKFSENSNPLGNITEEEYENFSFKCINVLKDLLINGFDEKSLEEKEKEYEELSNPVLNFYYTCLNEISDETKILTVVDLHREYTKFAKSTSKRLVNYDVFSKLFSKLEGIDILTKKLYCFDKDNTYYEYKEDFDIRHINSNEYTRTTKKYIKSFECVQAVQEVLCNSIRSPIKESKSNTLDKVDTLDKAYISENV